MQEHVRVVDVDDQVRDFSALISAFECNIGLADVDAPVG